MKALDELRNLMKDFSRVHTTIGDEWNQSICVDIPEELLDSCVDKIEKELKERYIELPLDKDGVPIHIGDEMMDKEKVRFIVSELDFMDAFVRAVGIVGDIKYYFAPSKIVHYHKSTVRELLEEALNKAASLDHKEGRWLRAAHIDDIVSEIAPKLQLKEESE